MAHNVWNRVHIDYSMSYKVIDFGTNRKRVYDFLLDHNNLGPILPRFRDIRAFVRQLKAAFSILLTVVRTKFRGIPLGVDLWRWGLQKANTPG